MIALDTSILLYAVNRHAPGHVRAARVVEDLIHGEPAWGVAGSVVLEFIRRVTHPHAVARPLAARDAVAFVTQVVEAGQARVLLPGPRSLSVLGELIGAVEVAGPLPAGIETAAILREHGVRELLSCDPGMKRYRFLTVIDPVHGEPWRPGARPERRYRSLAPRAIR
jgi:predicted nucleic acid-binding protein